MTILEKLMDGDIELDNKELKYILWATLVNLEPYVKKINVPDEGIFNVSEMLDCLEKQLNIES